MWGNMKEFIVGATYVGVIMTTMYLAIELLNNAVGVGV